MEEAVQIVIVYNYWTEFADEDYQSEILQQLRRRCELDAVVAGFVKHDAMQCGFCTPGFIMSAKALLERNPNPSEQEIRLAISGNLCRCTGYDKIVRSIQAASQALSQHA